MKLVRDVGGTQVYSNGRATATVATTAKAIRAALRSAAMSRLARRGRGGNGAVDAGAGGDAAADVQPTGSITGRCANMRLVLTGAAPDDCVPTRDLFDAAHQQRDWAGFLVPAACRVPRSRAVRVLVPQARPRRYHPSQMTGAGVSHDSAADALHEMQVRVLHEMGVDLGCGTGQSLSGVLAAMDAMGGASGAGGPAGAVQRIVDWDRASAIRDGAGHEFGGGR